MASYLQLERITDGAVDVNGPVFFENVALSGGSEITYITTTGEISFNAPGYYFMDWFVAPQFGLTANGSNFAVVSSEGDPELTGSSHVRVSATVGFAIIEVPQPGKRVRLVNRSDNRLTFSRVVNVKASAAVFAIAGLEGSGEQSN